MDYLIGDTIRLKATIKNLMGEEEAPVDISVTIYKLDGTELLTAGEPTLVNGTTANIIMIGKLIHL